MSFFSQQGTTGALELGQDEFFRAMVEAWDGLIYVGTSDFRICYLNCRFIERLGRDARGEYCYRALHGRSVPCPWCMQEVFQGKKHRGRFQEPGSGLWYDVLNAPLPLADGSFAKIAFIRESSEAEPAARELPVFYTLVDRLIDPVFLFCPENGRVFYANEMACSTLGYSRDDLLKMGAEEISESFSSHETWQAMVERIRTEESVLVETRHRCKDGSLLPVEVNASIVSLGLQQVIVAVARDITERKRAEALLKEEKNKVEAIMAAMGEGITVQDLNHRIIYHNDVIVNRGGNRLGELCYRAYMNRDRICDGCQMEKSLADGRIHRRQFPVEREGKKSYREVSACPLRDANGRITGCVEVVRDISEQRRLEQSREEVFSVVSHEMRTPLTVIRGFAEYLQETDVSPEEQATSLDRIVKESGRLQSLIDNLLSFQRFKAGFGLDALGPVAVAPLLHEVAESVSSPLCGQRIEIECAPDHPPVFGEAEKIQLAVRNLLCNAIKYSPAETTIVLGAHVRGDSSWLWVRDEGPGIPPEAQEKIFDRFYRVGNRQGPAGTGLGLALVREIAQAHGGRAWVESEPGRGAVFYLCLPLAPRE